MCDKIQNPSPAFDLMRDHCAMSSFHECFQAPTGDSVKIGEGTTLCSPYTPSFFFYPLLDLPFVFLFLKDAFLFFLLQLLVHRR